MELFFILLTYDFSVKGLFDALLPVEYQTKLHYPDTLPTLQGIFNPLTFPSPIPRHFPPLPLFLPPSFPSYLSSLVRNDVHVSGRQLENGLLALIEYLTQVRHKLNSNKTLR